VVQTFFKPALRVGTQVEVQTVLDVGLQRVGVRLVRDQDAVVEKVKKVLSNRPVFRSYINVFSS